VLKKALRDEVSAALNTLYAGTNNNVINLEDTSANTALAGYGNEIFVQIPSGSGKAPCVVRGTEVIVMEGGRAVIKRIEDIRAGDKVVDQHGASVEVLFRDSYTVVAQSHNSPYIVPKDYFGSDRPYRTLLISGDHGILVRGGARGGAFVYPANLPLRRIPYGTGVEYYHLLLMNDHRHCYLANGLEVDSLHMGPTFRKK